MFRPASPRTPGETTARTSVTEAERPAKFSLANPASEAADAVGKNWHQFRSARDALRSVFCIIQLLSPLLW
jgi:hypothetical protein